MSDVYKKQIFPLLILLTTSLGIWVWGPYLHIQQHSPLVSPEKRFYLISLLYLLWLLKILFIDTANTPDSSSDSKLNESNQRWELLQQRFQAIVNFLKNNYINKNGSKKNLVDLPWFLVVGPANAGKTTLLANSTIPYILSKAISKEDLARIPASDICDWWVSAHNVLVDIPSCYFTLKTPQDNHPTPNILWDKLIKLLSQSSQKKQIQGAIITLNLPELFNVQKKQEKSALVYNLKHRLADLRKHFGAELPIYIVISKCDLLPGFSHFFNECSTEELSQAWGITFPSNRKESLIDVFNERFNALIKRINKQVIWRMHQEREIHSRPLIKDFPQHIERLKEGLTSLLKTFATPSLNLAGVYLTSAAQSNKDRSSPLAQTIMHSSEQALLLGQPTPAAPRSYFVRQFFMQALTSVTPLTPAALSWQRKMIYSTVAGALALTAFIFGSDFELGLQKSYLLQKKLVQYQAAVENTNLATNSFANTLTLLDSLQQIATYSTHTLPFIGNKFSFYSARTEQTAQFIYHQAITNLLLVQIKNVFETYLSGTHPTNPENTYAVLQAYLMLNNLKSAPLDFILITLQQISPDLLNEKTSSDLSKHLIVASKQGLRPESLDKKLVYRVRKQLTSLPPSELAFIILKNLNHNKTISTVKLGTETSKTPIFVSKNIEHAIPNFFVAEQFKRIMNDEIPLVSAQALRGNYTLGVIAPRDDQPSLSSLNQQLRHQYLQKYVDLWESLVANIEPNTPKNLIEADEMIVTLTSNQSPLLELLKTIQQNTYFEPIQNSSTKLNALNRLLSEGDKAEDNLLYQVFVTLGQLHRYLADILTKPDVALAAREAAANRIDKPIRNPITQVEQIADLSPEPVKTWLHNIARQSWGFIVKMDA